MRPYLNRILALCLSFITLSPKAQEFQYDSIGFHLTEIIYTHNKSRALQIIDSFRQSHMPAPYKVLAANSLSRIEFLEGNLNHALKLSAKAVAISVHNNLYKQGIVPLLNLSGQYLSASLFNEAGVHLKKAKEKLKTYKSSAKLYGLLYSCESAHAAAALNFGEARRLLERSDSFFLQLPASATLDYILIQSTFMKGICFMGTQQPGSALPLFEHALAKLKETSFDDTPLKCYLLNETARSCFLLNRYSEAESFFLKSLELANSINLNIIKPAVYGDLSELYKKVNDTLSYVKYSEMLRKFQMEHGSIIPTAINAVTEKLRNESEENKKNSVVVVILCIAVVSALIYAIGMIILNQKRNKKRYQLIIKKLRDYTAEKEHTSSLAPAVDIDSANYRNKQSLINPETRDELLQKLSEFEKSKNFLDKKISLSVMAAMFETNTKYLSHVINTHKKKDFNNYINELRIYYVLEELKENPDFRMYKISHLAEMTGFSSHSKFTTIFKAVTGISPSNYISFIEKEVEVA